MRIKNPQRSDVRELRQSLGLSLEQMADYLGVSRSLLGMYEMGDRTLPKAASLTLAELQLLLVQHPLPPKPDAARQKAHAKEKKEHLQHHLRVHERKLKRVTAVLEGVQSAYNQSRLLLHVVELKRAGRGEAKIPDTLLKVMENKANIGLEAASPAVQAIHELKVAAHRHVVAAVKEMIAG